MIKYTQATWGSKAAYGGLGKLSTGQGCPSRFQSSSQDAASVIVTSQHNRKNRWYPMRYQQDPGRASRQTSLSLMVLTTWSPLIRYSNFFELDVLGSKTSKEIINKLKPHFARFGLPERLTTDNGPQFDCAEFQSFTRNFQFEHIKTSPRYPQSNGKAENSVKTAKAILKKAADVGHDSHLCLLFNKIIINNKSVYWILETHRQKEWIVLRHSAFSLEGLALYFLWLISCFSQKLCPMC